MAGSGNLQVLRIARSLRKRINSDISYGAHVAVHMAIGFLFLGGGRYLFHVLVNLVLYWQLFSTFPVANLISHTYFATCVN